MVVEVEETPELSCRLFLRWGAPPLLDARRAPRLLLVSPTASATSREWASLLVVVMKKEFKKVKSLHKV